MPHFSAKSLLVAAVIVSIGAGPNATKGSQQSAPVSLDLQKWHHVTFGDLTPTEYKNSGESLAANVNSSSSFLLYAFPAAVKARGVAFEWRANGAPNSKSAAEEETKEGDDAIWRVGILAAGKPPMMPFMAPAWVKAVRDFLIVPSNRLFFVQAGSRHPAGGNWRAPYTDDITIYAANFAAAHEKDGVKVFSPAYWDFPEPVDVAGIWLMSDGDNTKARFQADLRALALKL